MTTFEKSQLIVGLNEGGYQNRTNDPGNWYNGVLVGTNWGIAAPTLARYLGKAPTAEDMQNLKRETAEKILKVNFWDANNFGKLANQSVATLIYDGAVNHGVYGMRLIMEKVMTKMRKPLVYYKVFTPEGISVINRLNQKLLFDTIKAARAAKYKALNRPSDTAGWLHRLDRIKYVEQSSGPGTIMLAGIALIGICLIAFGL